MLTMDVFDALARAVQRYGQQALQHDVQRVTSLNVASVLLGFRDYRQARAGLLQGEQPQLTEQIFGRAYIDRATRALSHLHGKYGLAEATPAASGAFARQMVIGHDYAVWHLMDRAAVFEEVLKLKVSTIVADPRPWVSAALQRALTCELDQRYGGGLGLIDHAGLYRAGLPAEHALHHSAARFPIRKMQPNVFFQARVNHSCERLALPVITDAVLAEYDGNMLGMCDSVHWIYQSSASQAREAWSSLPGRRRERGEGAPPCALIASQNDQITLDMMTP